MTKRKHIPTQAPDQDARPIVGYEGLYSVTIDGLIWTHAKAMGVSRHGGIWMSNVTDRQGYICIVLFKDQIGKPQRVHRLVAKAWLEQVPRADQEFINHIDGDRTNNHVNNLEWCTPRENVVHAYRTGLNPGNRKLTVDQQNRARQRVFAGELARDVAREFGVSPSTMTNIGATRRRQKFTDQSLKDDHATQI